MIVPCTLALFLIQNFKAFCQQELRLSLPRLQLNLKKTTRTQTNQS
jgi:hypothetical protein